MSFPNVSRPHLAIPALMALSIFTHSPSAQATWAPRKMVARVRQCVASKLPPKASVLAWVKGFAARPQRIYSRAELHFDMQICKERDADDRQRGVKPTRDKLDAMLDRLVGYHEPTKPWTVLKRVEPMAKQLWRSVKKLQHSGQKPVSSDSLVKAVTSAKRDKLLPDGYVQRVTERIGESLAEHYAGHDRPHEHLTEIASLVDTLDRLQRELPDEVGHGAFGADGGVKRAQAIRNMLAKIVTLAKTHSFYSMRRLLPLGRAFDRAISDLPVAPLDVEATAKSAAVKRIHKLLHSGKELLQDAAEQANLQKPLPAEVVQEVAEAAGKANVLFVAAGFLRMDAHRLKLGDLGVVSSEGLDLPQEILEEPTFKRAIDPNTAVGALLYGL